MMQAYGLGLLPYYPLASGLLTGKYRRNTPLPSDARLVVHVARYRDRFINDSNWPVVEALEDFATQRGHTLLELAFSWLAAQPVVSSVIAGATRPEQVEANVHAADWELTAGGSDGDRPPHQQPLPRERERSRRVSGEGEGDREASSLSLLCADPISFALGLRVCDPFCDVGQA